VPFGTGTEILGGGFSEDFAMAIRVVCPNGHVLSVKDSLAGKSGLCPQCRAVVRVPQPRSADDFEDAILDMLGPKPADGHHAPSSAVQRVDPPTEHERSGAPHKSCFRCHQEIDIGTHICPHCHTYIASLSDFKRA
jgi:hypothetical protein